MSIKELAEVANLVTLKGVVPIKNVRERGVLKGKTAVLFNALQTRKINTDEEAARLLYNCSPNKKKYIMIRKRLLDVLITSVIQYDYSRKQHKFLTYKDNCQIIYFTIQKLVALGYYNTGVILAKKLLMESRVCSYTELEINALKLLRENATLNGNVKEFTIYDSEINYALGKFEAELKAESYCQQIEINYINKVGHQTSVGNEVKIYLLQMEKMLEQYSSDTIIMYSFRIKILANQILGNFHKTLEICEAAKSYLDTNLLFATKARYTELSTVKMDCWLAIRDYPSVIKQGELNSKLYRFGGSNWFSTQALIFLAAMHSGYFDKAREILFVAKNCKGYSNLPEVHKEKWILFEAYLLLALDFLRPNSINASTALINEEFNFNDNSIWHNLSLNKDKQGFNISLSIVQLLFFLYWKDFEQFDFRRKVLSKYARRNLLSSENPRTLYFLKLLGLLGKKKSPKQFFLKLVNCPLTKEYFIEGLEIIPYEILWENIISKKYPFL